MNVLLRRVSVLLLGFLLSVSDLAPAQTVVQTNVTVRFLAANLNGDTQSYQPFALRIFEGLKPDVVAIQEFNYGGNTPADFRSMLDTAFGTNFVYYRENYSGIPNGIISRYPIIASGSWVDTVMSSPNRGFAWAQLDVPGTNDLYVVSVHLLTTSAANRAAEASNLRTLIQANFPSGAWVVLAGDFNTDTRSEQAMVTCGTYLSDSPVPTDAQSGGNSNTSINRNHPHDYVLPSFSLATTLTNVDFPSLTFQNGLVFDSRVWTNPSDLANFAPVQLADSGNAQHMGVMKTFFINYTVTNASTDVPAIVNQPQSQRVEPGGNATFTMVASGLAPLSYQWFFNATNPISSATATNCTITNVQPSDAGNYTVVVTNTAGSVTSAVAVLAVGTPPAITGQPQGQSVNSGTPVTFSVAATGTAPLAYQWLFNGGSITNATNASLTLASAQPANAGTYSVVVTNLAGRLTSSNAVLSIDAPPSIVNQPQSLALTVGDSATFTVGAAGATPLYYQWQFGGTNVTGANSSSYTKPNIQTSDAGNYLVVITNSSGAITSAPAALTVNIQAQPVVIAQWNFNSNPADNNTGTGMTTPSTGSGTLSLVGGVSQAFFGGSTTDPAPTADNSGLSTTTYPASNAGNKTAGVRFNVSTLGYQNVSVRWDHRVSNTGSKYGRLQYTTNGTDFIDFPTGITVGTAATFEPRTNNLAVVTTVNDNPSFGFQIVAEFSGAAYVGANGTYAPSGTVRFDMVTVSGTAIPVVSVPVITNQPLSQAVAQGSNVTFTVGVTGSQPLSYQWQLWSTNLPGATGSSYNKLNVQPADGGNYSVVISNSAGAVVSSNAALTVIVPPSIIDQPLSQVAVAGSPASLEVNAVGSDPLAYQWQLSSTNLPGATNATLSWNNVTAAQAGTYTVVVTNLAGSTISSNALLSVYPTAAATLGSLTWSSGHVQLDVTGVPGLSYAVLLSTNLQDWIPVQTNFSPFTFMDTEAVSDPQRFYRAMYLP